MQITSVADGGVGPQTSTFAAMAAVRRWLVWQSVPQPGKKPLKVPHYNNGTKRGTTDTPEDWAQLTSYAEAKSTLARCGDGWGLAFALGPDGTGGHWQGIDFDDIEANQLADIANRWARGDLHDWGHVEMSPSGLGAHVIGYGKSFAALGSNGTGIEAYAGGRFFTVTEQPVRRDSPDRLVDLAEYVEQVLAPRHGQARSVAGAAAVETVSVDAKTVTELRSALMHMRSDDYHLWINMGLALRELGGIGRGLWMEWSAASEKFDPKQAARKWETFNPSGTGYQVVFAEAQRQGWVNPASGAAQVESDASAVAATGTRELMGRSLGGVSMRAIDWLWTGWIPKGYVTIFAGETGAGKSTVLADIAARVTTGAPWPEPIGVTGDWRVPGRVLWLGSEDGIEEMTIPRLTACRANLNNVIEIQGVVQQGKRNTFSMQDDIEAVGRWLELARAERSPFAMLVIDPVTSYLPGQKLKRVDLNDAGQLRSILEPWLILAQRYGIAVVCVTHFGKDTSRSMLHRVLGSAAFAQTCRSLCAVIEPPTTEDDEPGPFEKVLMQVKVNLPEHPGGAWKFSTERVEVGTDPRNGRQIYATRPDWDELDSAMTPSSVVGRARGPKSQHEGIFAVWLRSQFAQFPVGHWLPAEQIKWSAVRDKAASESWWNKHSNEHLDKENQTGTWMCRPKLAP